MERRVIIAYFVGFLGILSAATAFAAEAKKIKASQVIGTPSRECRHPRSPAYELGLTAAVSLLIAQITLIVCICSSSHHRNLFSCTFVVCLIFSWIFFIGAFMGLITAASLNDGHTYYCFLDERPLSFSVGAALSLTSVTLGIYCYLS